MRGTRGRLGSSLSNRIGKPAQPAGNVQPKRNVLERLGHPQTGGGMRGGIRGGSGIRVGGGLRGGQRPMSMRGQRGGKPFGRGDGRTFQR